MTQWLFDTLVWTAALIGLVLLVRRPVARHLGAKAAYALWLLPFLRLLLPPVVLPAWLAPKSEVTITQFTVAQATGLDASIAPTAYQAAEPVNWSAIAVVLWLLGAAIFLVIRFRYYFEMRSQLLKEARPVGEVDDIRLVETPVTDSPIAFGVMDKVVALPVGFMALTDKIERDLAIEHELAHHRARDLLANFVVQPLFALHWFNPLGWYGWRAMRRDQEAACDARVMASRGDEDRAAYAAIIANFAAGPNVALAAPMACPVIGEKSIIHRLRSLTMSDVSPRRRTAGRVMMGAALLALPLTASITYAESLTAPKPPAPVAAPDVAVAPPVPPAPPTALALQAAPEAPAAPDAVDEDKHVVVIREVKTDEDGKERKVIRREYKVHSDSNHKMSKEEREAMLQELRAELDNIDVEIDQAMEDVRVALIEMDRNGHKTSVRMECRGDKETAEWTDDKGNKVVSICKSRIMSHALTGLKEAREAIAENEEMSAKMRAEVLSALDEKIANWKE